VYAAARAVSKLEIFDFNVARHPVMGAPTLNVGNLHGGLNVNSVPDRAEIGIDLRTLPGLRHDRLLEQLGSYLGPEVALEKRVDVPSVWTAPEDPWMRDVFEICGAVSGKSPAV